MNHVKFLAMFLVFLVAGIVIAWALMGVLCQFMHASTTEAGLTLTIGVLVAILLRSVQRT